MNGSLARTMASNKNIESVLKQDSESYFRKVKSEHSCGNVLKISSKCSSGRWKRSRHSDESLSSSEDLTKSNWLHLRSLKPHVVAGQTENLNQECVLSAHERIGFNDASGNLNYPYLRAGTPPEKGVCLILPKKAIPIKEKNSSDYSSEQSIDIQCDIIGSNKHKQVHRKHAEKPHKCEECNKEFSQKLHLILHQRIHPQDDPSNCSSCKLAVTQQVSCRNVPIYKCEECEKYFSQKLQLILHQRVHKRERLRYPGDGSSETSLTCSEESVMIEPKPQGCVEKPFKCDECEKTFRQELRLVLHKRGHEKERMYQCPECVLRFSQLASLNYHKLAHTGQTMHTCEICSTASRNNSTNSKERSHTTLPVKKLSGTCKWTTVATPLVSS